MTTTAATSDSAPTTTREAGCPHCTDGLGRPTPVRQGSWRDRLRARPGVSQLWRLVVFVAGLVFVALGVALAVLPGPLTIPPVLLGLWIWSTEFAWARRFFVSSRRKAREVWAHARLHPVNSAAVTGGGLVLAGAAFWSVGHFELVDRARTAVGL